MIRAKLDSLFERIADTTFGNQVLQFASEVAA